MVLKQTEEFVGVLREVVGTTLLTETSSRWKMSEVSKKSVICRLLRVR